MLERLKDQKTGQKSMIITCTVHYLYGVSKRENATYNIGKNVEMGG
jgi:hypothetical protein